MLPRKVIIIIITKIFPCVLLRHGNHFAAGVTPNRRYQQQPADGDNMSPNRRYQQTDNLTPQTDIQVVEY